MGSAGIPARLFKARSLLRARRGVAVTQAQIAALVGVTEGQVGHWEKGRQKPDLEMIERLAAALEVSPEWLAFGRETKRPAGEAGRPEDMDVGAVPLTAAQQQRAIEKTDAKAARKTAESEPRGRRGSGGGRKA